MNQNMPPPKKKGKKSFEYWNIGELFHLLPKYFLGQSPLFPVYFGAIFWS